MLCQLQLSKYSKLYHPRRRRLAAIADYLVVKNKTDKSGKIDKANELGVKILDMGEFEKMIG